KDVRKLRPGIGPESYAATLSHQILEVELHVSMRLRRDHYNTRGRALFDLVEQQVGQQKWREVIHSQRHLVSVTGHGHGPADDGRAGVVDQNVKSRHPVIEILRQSPDIGERSEIGLEKSDLLISSRPH